MSLMVTQIKDVTNSLQLKGLARLPTNKATTMFVAITDTLIVNEGQRVQANKKTFAKGSNEPVSMGAMVCGTCTPDGQRPHEIYRHC